MNKKTNIWVNFLAGCTLAYIALLPQFYLIFDASNRHYLLWDKFLHASILVAIFSLGIIYFYIFCVGKVISRVLPDICRLLLIICVCFIAFRTLYSLLDRTGHLWPFLALMPIKLAIYVALPTLIWFFASEPMLRVIRGGLLALSPLLLFIVVGPIFYQTYSRGDLRGLEDVYLSKSLENPRPLKDDHREPSILIFVFDEWSFERAFGPASGLEVMSRTKDLKRKGLFFKDARSAGSITRVAMPRMLLPFNNWVQHSDYHELSDAVIQLKIQASNNSIFTLVPDHYLKIISGFGLDYSNLMQKDVDYALSYNDGEAFFRTFSSELERLLTSQLAFLRFVGYRRPVIPNVAWRVAQVKNHEDALFLLKNVPAPYMGIFHYCLPHSPYAWTGEGPIEPFPYATALIESEANYMNNLDYLDYCIAELLRLFFERASEYDLLIMTSDHAWRNDPLHATWSGLEDYPNELIDEDIQSPMRHVPLLIFSGSSNLVGVYENEFVLNDLHMLVQRQLEGRPVVDSSYVRAFPEGN